MQWRAVVAPCLALGSHSTSMTGGEKLEEVLRVEFPERVDAVTMDAPSPPASYRPAVA